jgi:hypothetical protein
MKRTLVCVTALGLTVAGCATGSAGIHAEYTPSMMYQGYSCQQLAMEDVRLRSDVAELKGEVDHNATNDKIMTGVGVALFWPALFFIKGNGEAESQYAELKGQHQAIQEAFAMKGCADPTSAASRDSANMTDPVGPMGANLTRF